MKGMLLTTVARLLEDHLWTLIALAEEIRCLLISILPHQITFHMLSRHPLLRMLSMLSMLSIKHLRFMESKGVQCLKKVHMMHLLGLLKDPASDLILEAIRQVRPREMVRAMEVHATEVLTKEVQAEGVQAMEEQAVVGVSYNLLRMLAIRTIFPVGLVYGSLVHQVGQMRFLWQPHM